MSKAQTDPKTIKPRRGDAISNFFSYGLIRLALLLPYETRVRFMGWLVSDVVAPLVGYRRRVRDNLAHVMPEMPKDEVERISRAVCNNMGRSLAEIYSGPELNERVKDAPITGPGVDAIEKAHAEGRPAMLVTAHLGNYEAARFALHGKGYNFGALYRNMANPLFNAHYVDAITSVEDRMFEQGRKGMVHMVRHLRSGGFLGIVTDLYVEGGTKLEFFGKPAFTSLASAELALKYNAVMVPVFSIRKPDGINFDIIALPEIPPSDPVTMTQAINDSVEKVVRENMEQWFWVHKRWKYADEG